HEVQQAASRLAGVAPAEPASDIALPMGMPPDLPSAADLDLSAPAASAEAPTEEARAEEAADVSFELDLSSFDRNTEPGAGEPAAGRAAAPADASAMFDRFDDARSEAMAT